MLTPLKAALFGSGDPQLAGFQHHQRRRPRPASSVDAGTLRRTDGTRKARRTSPRRWATSIPARRRRTRRPRRTGSSRRACDLQIKLMAAIEANPTLRQFKQQIRIDSTLMGLRIEIVDSQKRPMFAMSSDRRRAVHARHPVSGTLNDVPNRIIVRGHTGAVPYAGGEGGYQLGCRPTARTRRAAS